LLQQWTVHLAYGQCAKNQFLPNCEFVLRSLEAKIPSANGGGKYYLDKPLRFSQNDELTTLVLLMSSTNFLNCLSVATKLSTVLQACNTVA
jgi:hypothetical protein